jgi:Tfp pilus assembly protein PilF
MPPGPPSPPVEIVSNNTPVSATGLVERGMKLRGEKKLAEAGTVFAAALKADPKNVAAMVQAAGVHNETGKFDRAMELARAAVKLDADNSRAWVELGVGQLRTGRNLRAVESLRTAIAKDEKNRAAHEHLAKALESVGEKEEAAEWRAKARKIGRPVID